VLLLTFSYIACSIVMACIFERNKNGHVGPGKFTTTEKKKLLVKLLAITFRNWVALVQYSDSLHV